MLYEVMTGPAMEDRAREAAAILEELPDGHLVVARAPLVWEGDLNRHQCQGP